MNGLSPRNNIAISVLAGIGIVPCAFVLGSAILGVLGYILLTVTQCDTDSCSVILVIAVICGGIISFVAGINWSRKIYNLIREKRVNNKIGVVSFFAGVGVAVSAFIVLFILFLTLSPAFEWLISLFDASSSCQSCLTTDVVFGIAQIIGGLPSIVAGIVGGRKIYTFIKRNDGAKVVESA